jgi:hypothetical protein
VRDRHAAFSRSLAETAEPHLERHQQVAWADLLEQERANLRVSIHWAATRRDGETAQRLVAALTWFFVIRGHLREAKKLFDIALTTPGATPATHARALQARSYLGWHRLEGSEAVAMAREAAELARQVDDRRTEARALYASGILTADNGDGLTDLEASITIARDLGDLWCLAHALVGAGTVYTWRGDDSRQSQALLRESIAVCEAMGDTYIVNTSRFQLGRSLLMTGERAAGTAMLEAVVTRARESGDTFNLPIALSYLGMDYALCGDEELGFAYLDEAEAITRRLGSLRESQLAMALWMKAITLLTKQDPAVRPILEELMTLGVDRGGMTDRNAVASAGLAMVDVLDGDLESAEARLTAGQAALPANTRPDDSSFVHMVAAVIARAQGDLNTAEHFVHQALDYDADRAGDPGFSWRIEILETLAEIRLASGETRDGVRLLAATDATRNRHLRPRPQSHNNTLGRDLAAARQLLGDEEADTAWAEGLAMTINDAIALARRGGPRLPPTTD